MRPSVWAVVVLLLCTACGSATAGPTVLEPSTAQETNSQTVAAEPAGTTEHLVQIEIFQFTEESVTVAPGDSVRWQNNDEIIHTVTSGSRTYGDLGVVTATQTDGLFDFTLDGRVPDEATAAFTFGDAGTYSMICTIHPGIDMTVEVAG